MLESHEAIDQNQTMIVNFNQFAASSLDFFIYTFTKTTNWIEYHHIKQDILLKIAGIISEHGAEIAFPTSTIHLANSQEPPAVEGDLEQKMAPGSNSSEPSNIGKGDK
jgi:MscS family membrane protein